MPSRSNMHSSFGSSSLSCALRNSVYDREKGLISKSDIIIIIIIIIINHLALLCKTGLNEKIN